MQKRTDMYRIPLYVLVCFALFIAEDCAMPKISGVSMAFMLSFVVAMGMLEGPFAGAGAGVAVGFLMDIGGTAFGFSSMILLWVGLLVGLFVDFFRSEKMCALIFTAVAATLYFSLRFFFLYYLWYGDGVRYLYCVPLQIALAAVPAVPVYLLVNVIYRKFMKHKRV